jgi:hypothetical protein
MNEDPQGRHYERAHDVSRVLAMSDGVFAIIVTLLVLKIHVPDLHSGETLGRALRCMRPSLVAFLISFVVVAIAWVGHPDLFAVIRRTDPGLAQLRVPTTAMSGSLWGVADRPLSEGAVALRMYGILLVLIAATRIAMWL